MSCLLIGCYLAYADSLGFANYQHCSSIMFIMNLYWRPFEVGMNYCARSVHNSMATDLYLLAEAKGSTCIQFLRQLPMANNQMT